MKVFLLLAIASVTLHVTLAATSVVAGDKGPVL